MSLKVDLKSQESRRGFSVDLGWILVAVFLFISLIVYYAAGVRLSGVVNDRKKELQSWQEKVAGFSGIQGKLDALKTEIASIQAQITHLRELRYDPLRYSILLVRLSKLLPQNLWLVSLSIEPSSNQLTFSGSALEQAGHPPLASLAQFLRNLQNDPDHYFSDIVLQGTTSTGKTGNLWTYNLTAKYNIPLIQTGSTATPPPPPPPTQAPPSPGGKNPR